MVDAESGDRRMWVAFCHMTTVAAAVVTLLLPAFDVACPGNKSSPIRMTDESTRRTRSKLQLMMETLLIKMTRYLFPDAPTLIKATTVVAAAAAAGAAAAARRLAQAAAVAAAAAALQQQQLAAEQSRAAQLLRPRP